MPKIICLLILTLNLAFSNVKTKKEKPRIVIDSLQTSPLSSKLLKFLRKRTIQIAAIQKKYHLLLKSSNTNINSDMNSLKTKIEKVGANYRIQAFIFSEYDQKFIKRISIKEVSTQNLIRKFELALYALFDMKAIEKDEPEAQTKKVSKKIKVKKTLDVSTKNEDANNNSNTIDLKERIKNIQSNINESIKEQKEKSNTNNKDKSEAIKKRSSSKAKNEGVENKVLSPVTPVISKRKRISYTLNLDAWYKSSIINSTDKRNLNQAVNFKTRLAYFGAKVDIFISHYQLKPYLFNLGFNYQNKMNETKLEHPSLLDFNIGISRNYHFLNTEHLLTLALAQKSQTFTASPFFGQGTFLSGFQALGLHVKANTQIIKDTLFSEFSYLKAITFNDLSENNIINLDKASFQELNLALFIKNKYFLSKSFFFIKYTNRSFSNNQNLESSSTDLFFGLRKYF